MPFVNSKQKPAGYVAHVAGENNMAADFFGVRTDRIVN